jgi:eukaryotic-like serine/threonine-protein kinase
MNRVGTRIGNFVFRRLLGSGGMGEVYLAEHESLDEARVYKLLMPQLLLDEGVVKRFESEARAAAAIKHKNIMRARDFGRIGDSMYIEMDWFGGHTLATLIGLQPGPMPMSRMLAILAGVAAGIHAAHQKGIIHRDLKPENILVAMIDQTPDVAKVLDFGVAKLRGELAAVNVTQTGAMVGTPAYAAPEQFDPKAEITPAVDIWALGVIAYAMATGCLPFQTERTKEEFFSLGAFPIFHRITTQPPIDPRARNPNLPPPFAQVILRAVSVNPMQRFDSAKAFALALGESIGPEGLKIVRKYAPDFFDDANMLETARSRGGAPGTNAVTRYSFDRKLGEGGMAEVFVARTTGAEGFSRPVAIKRVLAHFSAHPQFGEMFIQEAQLVSKLAHPNIVSVLDFDRDTHGRLFLVMEYIDGKDLAALVKTGPLPPAVAIHVAISILSGLEFAHDNLVLHRDVSPHNVLLSWTGAIKVSDFGIAKALDPSGSGHSATVKGKPGYMAPEVISGGRFDARADLFGIGVVLWELVTGHRLFSGVGGMQEIFEAIVRHDAPPPNSVLPVPRDLEAVIMRLLARSPELRYPSATAAIAALSACSDCPKMGAGTSELVRLLVERFPEAPRSSASGDVRRERSLEPSMPPTSNLRPASVGPGPSLPLASPMQTTHGSAAGESLPYAPMPSAAAAAKRKRWPFVAAAGTIALAGALVAIVLTNAPGSGERAPSDTAIVAPSTGDVTAAGVPTTEPTAPSAQPMHPATGPSPDAIPIPETLPTEVMEHGLDAGITAPATDAASIEKERRLTPDPSPDERAKTSQRVRTAPAATGELVITTADWAMVTVDGKLIGRTPQRLTLKVGRHKLKLTHGQKQLTKTIEIMKDKTLEIDEDPEKW